MADHTRTRLYKAYQITRNALIKQMAGAGETSENISRALSLKPFQISVIAEMPPIPAEAVPFPISDEERVLRIHLICAHLSREYLRGGGACGMCGGNPGGEPRSCFQAARDIYTIANGSVAQKSATGERS